MALQKSCSEKDLLGDKCPDELRFILYHLRPLKYADVPDYSQVDGWLKVNGTVQSELVCRS
jgi:hypothetical protein